jgi:hypothetical protein
MSIHLDINLLKTKDHAHTIEKSAKNSLHAGLVTKIPRARERETHDSRTTTAPLVTSHGPGKCKLA